MPELRRITFVVDEFTPQKPAQQILDRFLLGYPRDGEWRKFAGTTMVAIAPRVAWGADLGRRVKEHGLMQATDDFQALRDTDAVVFVSGGLGLKPDPLLHANVLTAAGGNARACFIYGALNDTEGLVSQSLRVAEAGDMAVLSGTWVSVAPRLPQVEVPAGAKLAEALVVVQGPNREAELLGLDLLLSLVEKRHGGESGVERVESFSGQELWQRGDRGEWSWPLLAAAISRSNSPQGDALKDARTQDLSGLGLVPKLARAARGVTLQHKDGLRSTVLVLDGVVADINFAVQLTSGGVLSAQVLRGPAPAENHFSRLVAVLDDFFRTGTPPWPITRSRLLADMLGRLM